MNLASSTALKLTVRRRSGLARAWSSLRSTLADFFRPSPPTLSLDRPAPLPEKPPTKQQARDLKFGNYPGHPGYGCDPPRAVAIFGLADAGSTATQCDLFDDIIGRDCTLRDLFEQREQAVAGRPSVIQPGRGGEPDNELAARALEAALDSLAMIDWEQHQLGYNRYGWAATELVWDWVKLSGFGERRWCVPVHLANVPARRFRVDVNRNELLLVTDEKPQGEPLAAGTWCVTRRPGPLAQSALMRTGIWPALWKGMSVRDAMAYSEMYGIPLLQVMYDDVGQTGGAVADPKARAVAEEIVQRMGSSGGAVTPKSIEVKVHDAARAAGTSPHAVWVALCNAELSKLVNGSTLANDNAGSGGASYALGAVHANVAWSKTVFDAAKLSASFKQSIAAPFVQYNQLAAKPPALHKMIAQDMPPLVWLQCADLAKNKLGVEISINQVRRTVGFSEPLNELDSAPGLPAPAPAAAPTKEAA